MPKIVLARMALNVLLNGAMGMVPGVGEVFSFWFRPSSRNYNLLLKHAPQAGPASRRPPEHGGRLGVRDRVAGGGVDRHGHVHRVGLTSWPGAHLLAGPVITVLRMTTSRQRFVIVSGA